MKVAIIGGTGYGAIELIRFLYNHPYAEIEAIISHSQSGQALGTVYPHTSGVLEKPLEELVVKDLAERVEIVFFATPPAVSKDLAPQFLEHNVKCIDLSGDFRLRSPMDYQEWYGSPAADESYLEAAVYGLSEIYGEEIAGANLVANPGCYPTATLLGLLPAVQNGWIEEKSIIIDAKSGVSGAGRGTSLNTHYPEMNENLKAYKLGQHKHIPEIEQEIGKMAGHPVKITFSTHLVPMTRGIMSTIYADIAHSVSTDEMIDMYTAFYQEQPFVRIRRNGELPATREVHGSNYCDIGLHADKRTGKLTIISVIDNLVKGASGQAIQNMNLLKGWDVATGLNYLPIYP
ncbi:N-acetyl-gamma-glutamyl-phosphate reductase [Sediminibacillus halophilus]|uniref:N-acetyl-gamma-glutamyl-phosphate reductase n=1 Tax=Sediminibacillus halophilus TaxID=482461 RepID=A0A1G9TH13_9BACI|nr:N-acetyl-gamma-glutamyl-phosphate reductase [Sediminibacillus halophilus]SDM47036.1 N-acetyl-gamma-glutamyl-phosphate reductase [Sediminibacillus halophilus]